MKSRVLSFSLAATMGGLFTLSTFAADWPQWRGANRADHSPDTGLFKTWPDGGPKRLWMNTDVGLGYSGYAIVGGRLYTVGLRDGTEYLIAVDTTTGEEIWSTKVGGRLENRWGDGPRTTPTVDGDRIYALSGRGELVCARLSDGKELWSVSMTEDLGGKLPGWGYTESVLVDGDLVICSPGGDKGTLAALDKMTGALRWQTKGITADAHYSSPIVFEHDGKRQYAKLIEKQAFGVDAKTGNILWTTDWPAGRTAVIPTPIYDDGLFYITSGYGAGSKQVKLDGTAEPDDAWSNKVMKNHHGGVIKVGDYLYGYSDGPGWVCQDWKTGEEIWADESLGKGAIHYADGMLYCLDESKGTVVLIEATPKGWNEKGRFTLDPQTRQRSSQGKIWTHPVVVNGKLYLRDQELLYCYDVKG
jgi:outer membrane protein assembly factor BamB